MTNIEKALIISGGDIDYHYQKQEGIFTIAVDGGLAAADRMCLPVDVILGDFDTVSLELLERYKKQGIKVIQLNVQKDDTDTQAAVCYAISHGFKKIDLLGATGSRFDHAYANMFLLKMAYEQGVSVCMYTGLSKIYLIHKEKHYKKSDFYGKYISFLPFDGPAMGVTLKGFQYPLDCFDFNTDKTYRLGVSNEPLLDSDASVFVEKGYLLAIESLEDKKI